MAKVVRQGKWRPLEGLSAIPGVLWRVIRRAHCCGLQFGELMERGPCAGQGNKCICQCKFKMSFATKSAFGSYCS